MKIVLVLFYRIPLNKRNFITPCLRVELMGLAANHFIRCAGYKFLILYPYFAIIADFNFQRVHISRAGRCGVQAFARQVEAGAVAWAEKKGVRNLF